MNVRPAQAADVRVQYDFARTRHGIRELFEPQRLLLQRGRFVQDPGAHGGIVLPSPRHDSRGFFG